jgi:hypothetical protein
MITEYKFGNPFERIRFLETEKRKIDKELEKLYKMIDELGEANPYTKEDFINSLRALSVKRNFVTSESVFDVILQHIDATPRWYKKYENRFCEDENFMVFWTIVHYRWNGIPVCFAECSSGDSYIEKYGLVSKFVTINDLRDDIPRSYGRTLIEKILEIPNSWLSPSNFVGDEDFNIESIEDGANISDFISRNRVPPYAYPIVIIREKYSLGYEFRYLEEWIPTSKNDIYV